MKASERGDAGLVDPFGVVGTAIDAKYWVERVGGSGGFGVVYRAHHLHFDSPVALKVFRATMRQTTPADPAFGAVLREGRLLFNLGQLHPSFVRVLDAGALRSAEGMKPYLAMEWLEGITLHQELVVRRDTQTYLSLEEVLALLDPVAGGLGVAHSESILHRDVKPANIFLSQRGGKVSARILDLGLARSAHGVEIDHVCAEVPCGARAFTPAYAAPEQWLPRLGDVGPWTDVYSLALVCVDLLNARVAPVASTTAEWLATCSFGEANPPVGTADVKLSDATRAVFQRALARDPRCRFRDAGAFWSALQAAAGSRPARVEAPALLGFSSANVPTPAAHPSTASYEVLSPPDAANDEFYAASTRRSDTFRRAEAVAQDSSGLRQSSPLAQLAPHEVREHPDGAERRRG